MHDNWYVLLLISIIVLFESSAQACAHQFHLGGGNGYWVVGALLYGAIIYLLAKAHDKWDMGKVNGLWSAISIIAVTLTGVVVFGETVSVKEWAGLVTIAAGAVVLMTNGDKKKTT